MLKSALDGVLLVDKPEGPTSHDMVAVARRALGVKRIGHAGTLDPMATGLLVLMIGRATRLATFLSGMDKTYRGTLRLGIATDTYDRDGTPSGPPRPVIVDERDVGAAFERFQGTVTQVPPVYSAKKVHGTPMYRLARRSLLGGHAQGGDPAGPPSGGPPAGGAPRHPPRPSMRPKRGRDAAPASAARPLSPEGAGREPHRDRGSSVADPFGGPAAHSAADRLHGLGIRARGRGRAPGRCAGSPLQPP